MAREQAEGEAKPRGRPPKGETAAARKKSRSTSRGRQGKTAKSPPSPSKKKSKSPSRKSSPARTASPKTASPARNRSPGKKSAASRTRSSSPGKKKTPSLPARGRSATRKGASPPRGRSPTKKTPKSPPKKEKASPRKQSKSPARRVPVVALQMLADEPLKKVVGESEPDSAAKSMPVPVTSPRPVGLRQRINVSSASPLNSSASQRGEAKFEGTATIFEKYGASSPFSREPSLRVSARIAAMQPSSEDEEEDTKREPERKAEEKTRSAVGNVGRSLLDGLKAFGWSATLGSLSCVVLAPAVLLGLYLLCSKERCTVSTLPALPKTLRAYLHWKIAVGYGLFLLVQAVLQAIPVGRTVYGFPSKLFERHVAYRYRLNAWLNLLGTAALCGALTHYGFPATAPYRYAFQLLVTALVASLVLALLLYVKGHFAPKNHRHPLGNTGNVPHDFVVGRELAPRLGGTYDLSVLLFRTGLMTWAVLLASMAWYDYLRTGTLNVNFAVCVACQFVYVCLAVFHEVYYLSSVFVTEDGAGYGKAMACLAGMPFASVLPAKFLLEHKQVLPLYCLPGIVLLFLTGLVLLHVALKRKYCFRRNWPDPSTRGQGMDYLTDKSGNRLLVSGVWGFVRHPNYLGDLLCFLSYTLLCGFRHLLPFYPLLASAAFLAVRTARVERRCQERYGDLWRKYAERVKYRIVPYVF